MAKKIPMIGRRFGKLVVTSQAEHDVRGVIHYNCSCDCGNIATVNGASLRGGTKSCGCLKKTHFIDLTNQKFNNLLVAEYLGKDNTKNNIYRCICDCGGTIICQGSDVKCGKIRSCGCKNFTKQISDAKDRGIEPLIRHAFAGCKRSERGYEFELSYEFYKNIIFKNCHYCGSEPSNIKKDKRSFGERVLRYNGVDRVDNDIGYIESNCVPCCRNCNIAKHTYSVEFFKELVTKIYHNFVLKKT